MNIFSRIALWFFIFWGVRVCGYNMVSVHTYDDEGSGEKCVDAATFSTNEKYIEKVMEIEV